MTDAPTGDGGHDGIDPAVAERLARLRARRAATPSPDRSPVSTPPTPDPSPVSSEQRSHAPLPPPTAPGTPTRPMPSRAMTTSAATTSAAMRRSRSAGRRGRRRSPAATAKIVTVGASTTAVLGLVAGYGYAEHRPADPQLVDDQSITSPTAEPTGAAAPVTPVAPAAPSTPPSKVTVVLVDPDTGQELVTVTGSSSEEAFARALDVLEQVRPVSSTTSPVSPDGPVPAADAPGAPVAPDTPAVVAADPQPVPRPASVDLAVPAPPVRVAAPAPAPAPAPTPAPAPAPQASSGGS